MAVNKMELKFDKICRACLQTKKDMRPLFEQLTATMLMGISKVQVAIGDGLPTQLCLQCVHQISRCHAFKELVERNDVTLREQAKHMVQVQKLVTTQDCAESYMQYMELPLPPNPSQVLDNFFNDSAPAQIQEPEKDGFDLVKVFIQVDQQQEQQQQPQQEPAAQPEEQVITQSAAQAKEDDPLNSDEESYIQMVVSQATTSVAPGRHVCNLCRKEFKYARWLKQHMRSHSNWIKANCKKPPKCNVCDRTFKGPGMLKMHMRTHEQRPPKQPTCSVCQRTFATKTLLYRHRQTHFEQKTHECTVCEKRFFSAYALRSHMARHRGERPYICSLCHKSFYNPTDLKVHFRLHTGEKPLKCSECNKTFRRHSTLCQHMKKHRGIRNHVCKVCNKAFYEISKLNAHMRVHTGERPYECQYCDRRFAQQSALIYHKRTHTGEKPYNCKLCSARFTTSSARNNHLVTHSGTKRYVCPVCCKGCTSLAELRAHTSKHTGEKLFACEQCPRRFSSASYLAVHRRFHAGERNHCVVCGKGFGDASAYKKHMKTHDLKVDNTPISDNDTAQMSDNLTPGHVEIQEAQTTTIEEQSQPTQATPQAEPEQKRYKCGFCVKSYLYLPSLRKHMLTHVQAQQAQQTQQQQQVQQQQVQQQQVQVQQVQQQQVQQQQVQQLQQAVLQVGGVQQLAVPIHAQHVQPGIVQNGAHTYPVISSVQSLQLQQTQHQVNAQPQQLQLQTIQIHPQHQPIQIHAVGVQQVQQQQLHVATSTCQTMLPNILQLQPAVAVGGLGQQELGRIILQPPQHPAVYAIHH